MNYYSYDYDNFIIESNKIEGIVRAPTKSEAKEFERFMELPIVTLNDLIRFVGIYQPGTKIRNKVGLNVRVGNHLPPAGGMEVQFALEYLLATLTSRTPYENHIRYETLHPFTDGNGRSGRMLWAWQFRDLSLGFLHRFYYQALDSKGKERS